MINEHDYLSLGTSNKRRETPEDHGRLGKMMSDWRLIRDFCKKSPGEINDWQFRRIKQLIRHAFNTVELYRRKYSDVGFEPGDLKGWEDFGGLPILMKDELIDGFPNEVISSEYDTEFTTRSSGSSGRFVTMAVSPWAVYMDTIQGARQFYFQSGGNYRADDRALFIYTCPWWVSSIDGKYPTEFLPTTTSVQDASAKIEKIRPKILSVYPTYLKRMMGKGLNIRNSGVELIVVHSEQTTKREREEFSDFFGVPVRDEFSSEELTRIALECTNGKYHIEEDACYIEIVDTENGRSITNGEEGVIIGTNLLNEATPIIRYSQGDIGSIKDQPSCACGSNFRVMESPRGRYMDSITTKDGEIIPASCFMDIAYNWYLDLDVPIHGMRYQIVQSAVDVIDIYVTKGRFDLSPSQKRRIRNSLYQLLPGDTSVYLHEVDEIPNSGTKYRPVLSTINDSIW